MEEEWNDEFVEFTRIDNRVEADLFAAFLEDSDVQFKLIENAQTMASLMPAAQVPVVFYVLKEDMQRAAELLQEYKEEQQKQSEDEDESSPTT